MASDDSQKKNIKKSKKTIVKVESPQLIKEESDKKYNALMKKAKSLESVSPKDEKSVSSITGKPKHFVRKSAKPPVKVPRNDTDFSIDR